MEQCFESTYLAVFPDGRLASLSVDSSVQILSADRKAARLLESHKERNRKLIALAVLPNGILAGASADGKVYLWDVDGRPIQQALEGHEKEIRCLVVLSDGLLASGSKDSTIRIWGKDGKCLHVLQGHILIQAESAKI